MSMMAQLTEAIPNRLPFWFKPVSTFGLYNDDDVYQKFTYVGRVRSSLVPHHICACRFRSPSQVGVPDIRRLHCSQSFTPSCYRLRMSG